MAFVVAETVLELTMWKILLDTLEYPFISIVRWTVFFDNLLKKMFCG